MSVRGFIMTETELEIIRLKWRVGILQGILVKLWTISFSALTGEPQQESHRRLLAELDITQEQNYKLLLSSAVPEDRRVLLAEEFAQVVEEVKAFMNSMLATP